MLARSGRLPQLTQMIGTPDARSGDIGGDYRPDRKPIKPIQKLLPCRPPERWPAKRSRRAARPVDAA
jgi:hypothetical protein